jgi:hypothetical protein
VGCGGSKHGSTRSHGQGGDHPPRPPQGLSWVTSYHFLEPKRKLFDNCGASGLHTHSHTRAHAWTESRHMGTSTNTQTAALLIACTHAHLDCITWPTPDKPTHPTDRPQADSGSYTPNMESHPEAPLGKVIYGPPTWLLSPHSKTHTGAHCRCPHLNTLLTPTLPVLSPGNSVPAPPSPRGTD